MFRFKEYLTEARSFSSLEELENSWQRKLGNNPRNYEKFQDDHLIVYNRKLRTYTVFRDNVYYKMKNRGDYRVINFPLMPKEVKKKANLLRKMNIRVDHNPERIDINIPDDFQESLLVDKNLKLKVKGYLDQYEDVLIIKIKSEGLSMERDFNYQEDSVYHNGFFISPKHQGKGLAKKILKSHFNLYKRMKMKKVYMTANVKVGGYAWAKYGFIPDSRSEFKELQYHLLGEFERFEKQLDKKTVKAVLKLIKSNNPKSIWAIADLKHKVKRGTKEMDLGKALLLGTEWNGIFNLNDNQSIRRFNAYVNK